MTITPAPRTTRQRTAVMSVLDGVTEFVSAQEVHALLREREERVGLTTVYRALQSMVEADEVDSLRREDGEMVYRRCGTDHHHHLTCRSCQTTIELLAPEVEGWARTVAGAQGFTEVNHTIELVGLCATCSKADAVRGG